MLRTYYRSFIWTLKNQPSLKSRIIELLIRIISLPLSALIVFIFILIKPFIKVRFGFLYNRRIGHLAMNTELFLRRKQLGVYPDDVLYIFFSYKPANDQLLKMFKRNLCIIEHEWVTKLFSPIGMSNNPFRQSLPMNSNENYEFKATKCIHYFTPDEEKKGNQELKKMGIPIDAWFVCIFARDNVYANMTWADVDHSSTDHRNADIDSYIDAAKYIIERGGYVVRMGYGVSKAFGLKHQNVIDYAIDFRSDFMDIFLSAKCRFFIGTSSGGSDVSTLFDVPKLAVNYVPIGASPIGKNEFFIPKKVIYQSTGMQVPFRDVIKLLGDMVVAFGIAPEEVLAQNGMLIMNNTDLEIFEATKEMFDRLDDTFVETKEYQLQLEKYYKILEDENYWAKNAKNPIAKSYIKNMILS